MRKFSSNVKALLTSDTLSAFFMVKLTINNITLMDTTLPYDITVPGIGTFVSDNGLISVETPRLTTVVDRAAYKIIYADPDLEFKSRFEIGAIGSPVQVYAGFFNTTDSVLGSANPGAPMTDPEDIILLYSGIIDSNGHTLSEDAEIFATFECSSPMADLNAKKRFLTTDAELRKRNPADTALQYSYIGSATTTLGWGKIV
jgi:hypothetical protein